MTFTLNRHYCRCYALTRQPNQVCYETPIYAMLQVRRKNITDRCLLRMLEDHTSPLVPDLLAARDRAAERYAKERPADKEGLAEYKRQLGLTAQ